MAIAKTLQRFLELQSVKYDLVPVLPENSYHTQSSRQPFIMMM